MNARPPFGEGKNSTFVFAEFEFFVVVVSPSKNPEIF